VSPSPAPGQAWSQGREHCLSVPRFLGGHRREIDGPEQLSRARRLSLDRSDQLLLLRIRLHPSSPESAAILALSNSGELTPESARPGRPPPEQIEGRIVQRLILGPAYEDGSACNPHIAPVTQTEKGESPEEGRRLSRVHVQADPAQQPAELHDVGGQSRAVGGVGRMQGIKPRRGGTQGHVV
jgi:hypothetical protein